MVGYEAAFRLLFHKLIFEFFGTFLRHRRISLTSESTKMVNLDRHLLPFPLVLVNEMQNERTSVSSRIVLFGFFAIFSLHFKTEHTETCSFEKKKDG